MNSHITVILSSCNNNFLWRVRWWR